MFTNKKPALMWILALIARFALTLTSIGLEKPVGSLAGQIALEQGGFGLHSYDIKGNKVYAVALGPRGTQMIERGVWVKPDGRFQIDRLPVGEYTLKVRAPGYASRHEQSIYVDEGQVTELPRTLSMTILDPSVNIASNSRV